MSPTATSASAKMLTLGDNPVSVVAPARPGQRSAYQSGDAPSEHQPCGNPPPHIQARGGGMLASGAPDCHVHWEFAMHDIEHEDTKRIISVLLPLEVAPT